MKKKNKEACNHTWGEICYYFSHWHDKGWGMYSYQICSSCHDFEWIEFRDTTDLKAKLPFVHQTGRYKSFNLGEDNRFWLKKDLAKFHQKFKKCLSISERH